MSQAATLRRNRFQDEEPSAIAYWGTGLMCLAVLVLVFWLAGLRF